MAQNTLEIIIKANSSKAVSEIKKLDTTIGKISGTSAKGFDAIKAKWTELDNKLTSPGGWKIAMGAAGAAVGVLTTVGVAVKKLADDFMNYAFQVEDFGRIIGATPEEASKIIQVADDVRLSVESMTTSMKMAVDKGYEPNIEGLKRMADEYNAIPKEIDRTRFAMDIFGKRAGPEMAKLLELGSAKIEEMGDSIEGTARLMTEKGIQAAKEYYAALDDLGDATQSVTLAFGSKLVPALTDGATLLAEVGTSALSSENVLTNMTQALFSQKVTVEEAAIVMGLYTTGIIDGAKANEFFRGPVADSTNALIEERKALQYTAEGVKATSQSFAAGMGEVQRFGAALSNVSEEASKIKTIDAKLEFSFPNFADKMQNLIDSVNWNAAGGSALDQFMQGFSADIAGKAPEVQKQIAADVGAVDIALRVETGEITKSEGIQQLMDLADTDYSKAKADIETIMKLEPSDITPYLENIIGLGENTPEAAKQTEELSLKIGATDTAMKLGQSSFDNWNIAVDDLEEKSRNAAKQVGALNTQLKSMPKNIDVKINITTSGGAPKYTGSTGEKPGPRPIGGKGATGLDMIVPPGYRGDTYPIYATSGERVIVQTPAQQRESSSINNVVQNFYITPAQNINVRELARQVAREQQRAGVT